MLYIRCSMHIIPNMLGALACMSKQLYMHMNVSMYASYTHACMHAWVIRTWNYFTQQTDKLHSRVYLLC